MKLKLIAMSRKPNTNCTTCGEPLYRRPNETKRGLKPYCSRKCQGAPHRAKLLDKKCTACGKSFQVPTYQTYRKYCSKSCGNKSRQGMTYTKTGYQNKNERRLALLIKKSDTNYCMIQGCHYNRTLDVHRLIPGKQGGEYEIGNMFAICPNHHCEIHRKIIKVEKVDTFELVITEDLVESQFERNEQEAKPKQIILCSDVTRKLLDYEEAQKCHKK